MWQHICYLLYNGGFILQHEDMEDQRVTNNMELSGSVFVSWMQSCNNPLFAPFQWWTGCTAFLRFSYAAYVLIIMLSHNRRLLLFITPCRPKFGSFFTCILSWLVVIIIIIIMLSSSPSLFSELPQCSLTQVTVYSAGPYFISRAVQLPSWRVCSCDGKCH